MSAALGLSGVGAARERQPRSENAQGDFYVDHTCIGEPGGCVLAARLAPAISSCSQMQTPSLSC